MDKEQKQGLIEEYREHPTDTGSSSVQVAVLTHRIRELTEHLREHKNDEHSRYGLIKMVGLRRRHLEYLAREDIYRSQKELKTIRLQLKKLL